MPVYLIELVNPADEKDTRLMVWSTDSPYTYGLTIEELCAAAQTENDPRGHLTLSNARMLRVRARGHSMIGGEYEDPDARVLCNRAGPEGAEISRADIWRYYVDERPGDEVWCCLPRADSTGTGQT